MAKILKNTTLVSVPLSEMGLADIPASGQITIRPEDYMLLATDDVINYLSPLITAGDVIVNDGDFDLAAARGIDYLKYPDAGFSTKFLPDSIRGNGFVSKNTQEAIEEARDVALNVRGKLLDFEFSSSGTTFNKWLNVGHPSIASNDVPYVAEWSGIGAGLSFSNEDDNADTDIEIYVNGTKVYTWEIRNKRTAWLALIDESNPIFGISQGDRLSIFAKKVTTGTGGNPSNINGEIIIQVTTMANGSGGTQNGV